MKITGGHMLKADFGVTGLGVMGRNLALNMERNGFRVAVHNRTDAKTRDLVDNRAKGKNLIGTYSYADFVDALEKPRRIMIMVKAGAPVDAVIEKLKPLLDPGDILIDGGNSFYEETERRNAALKEEGLLYLGAGISGGEEGALWGPSIMPGGDREAWEVVAPFFKAVAAEAEDGVPCVDYMGPRGAGHYVKMVHNGIEYADMALIGEIYDLLGRGLKLSETAMGELFAEWNQDILASYLIEITADILKTKDPETDQPIVRVILDEAKQKGTGKWTSQDALDLGAPTHTINAAVTSRIISSLKSKRVEMSKVFVGPEPNFKGDQDQFVRAAKAALYTSKVISYAQGFGLLRLASDAYAYNLDLKDVAKIWRAGCIIRADLLDDVMAAFEKKPDLDNLLEDDFFREVVETRQGALRYLINAGIRMGIPVYALSASLGYFDALRSARLPANLTQAQRDYFGAHTYHRLDKDGTFHTEWNA
jgi:6-phosphogluconate dehydrogenase